jgi:hypothetical protein
MPFGGMGLIGIVLIAAGKRSRKLAAVVGSAALMAILLTSCGSHRTPMPGTPPGMSTITVTATSSTSTTKTTTFTLNVQ